ncbi:transposase [Micromonospora sp. NPDC005206]|uniref:IS110 family transposase n=1 Tax=Micromonospora sp. NPDC005206 TaxID=3157022 RepID=UPI0033BE7B92
MAAKKRTLIGGVDTHRDTHHAAVIDSTGGLLGDTEFPATTAGYADLLAWMRSFGRVTAVGVEGTGSYGAGLARYLTSKKIAVVEVDRPDRRARRAQGKSDPIDAIAAARATLAGTAMGTPKTRTGPVEAIRAQAPLPIDDPHNGSLIMPTSRAQQGARHAPMAGRMDAMPAIPESTMTSLAQRLRAHARENWPQLAAVHVRYRAQFAYVEGELGGGERLPLMRLRYGGSAHRWGTAIYVASTNSYEDQIWFSRTTEEAFDLVCDLHVRPTTP